MFREKAAQPESTLPTNRPRACDPGAADFASNWNVHCTGSSAAPDKPAATTKIPLSLRNILVRIRGAASRGIRRERRMTTAQLRFDTLVDFSAGEFRCYADRI